jgi:hypothetical protein
VLLLLLLLLLPLLLLAALGRRQLQLHTRRRFAALCCVCVRLQEWKSWPI